MSLQYLSAGSCEHVVNSCCSVSAGRREFVSSRVEAGVQDFVVVSSKRFDAVASADVPELASLVDRACDSVLACEVKLGARQLARVSGQSVNALASVYIPNLCSVVERTCEYRVAVGVELQADDFGGVSLESVYFLARLDVPDLRSSVHRPCCQKVSIRVERESDNLHCVANESVQKVASVAVPQFCSPVKRSRHDFVSERHVEGHCVDDVLVSLETEQLFARDCIPNFSSSIVASCNKLVSVFIKSAVCKRKYVGFQDFEAVELLFFVAFELFNQLKYQFI